MRSTAGRRKIRELRARLDTSSARERKPDYHLRRIRTQSGSWVTERIHFKELKFHRNYAMVKSSLRGWVYLHRVIAESAVGRWLRKHEEVHHLDGERQNNSKDNLLVCSSEYHRELHQRCLEQHGSWHLPGDD